MTDATPEVQVSPPTEPGFYHYDGGAQSMIFLLDSTGTWWTCFDNGDMQPCDWGYIEQALSVYNLRKLKPALPDDWRVTTNLPVFLPGNNRNFEEAQGRAGITHDGKIIVTLQDPAMADELVDMAKQNFLFQIGIDYKMPVDAMKKINNQFAMNVPADMDKVREVLRMNGYLASDIPDVLESFETAGIKFMEEK